MSSAQLYQETFILWKFVVGAMGEVLTNLKETIKLQCKASHCTREGKGIVKRALHFIGNCQKWELAKMGKGFSKFFNLPVNNELAMAIRLQTSFFVLSSFSLQKWTLANPFLEIFCLIFISLSPFHSLQLYFYFRLHSILHSFLAQPHTIIALLA